MLLVRLSGCVGGLIEKMAKGGRPALITLALAVVALRFFEWWEVLLAYAALLLLWLAVKATNRVVIDTFEDHTMPVAEAGAEREGSSGEDRSDPHRLDTSGMAALLAARLGEMRNVYQLLEEPLGSPHPGRPVDGAVQLEDIGDVLRSAFTTQSSLSVGPITLPVGALMALMGRLVQAPRLHGVIYGDERQLTLTAGLATDGRDYVWRVVRNVGESETSARARAVMVEDLAYRVFTDLSLHGQAEWPATRDWLYALEERQACQRSPRDRRVHLKNAEEYLHHALSEDERFYLAAYNLGIVYRQLAEDDARSGRIVATELRGVPEEAYTRSALRVFAYAIDKLDHGRWEAYYGLALTHWKRGEQSEDERERRFERAILLCNRAIELTRDRAARAQIRDLQATAQRTLLRPDEALATWHTACREVLTELTLAQLTRARAAADGQRLLRLRKQAAQCILNLAIAYDGVEPDSVTKLQPEARGLLNGARRARARRFARIHELARFAVRLADVDAEAHARFAEIACRWGQPDLAIRDLRCATQIDPGNPAYWAPLAKLLAVKDPAAARTACAEAERKIDFASAADRREAMDQLIQAYRALGESEREKAVARRAALGHAISSALESDRPEDELQALRAKHERNGRAWETALVERHLGQYLLKSAAPDSARQAEQLFASAIERLKPQDAVDIRRWRLLGEQACAIARQHDRTRDALPLAERDVSIDPLSAPAWRALATVREHGGDYQSACAAWERVLLIDPGDPEDHVALAMCQWKLAEWVSDAGRRRDVHRSALDNLHRALTQYDSDQMEDRRRTEWWSAACHWMLGEFAEMPEHLWFILASIEDLDPSAKDNALAARVELALSLSYRQTRHFAKAEDYAQRSIDHGDKADADGFPADGFPGAPLREHGRTLGEIRVLARAQLAGCHADRDGRLPFAEAQARDADRLVHELVANGFDVTEVESRVLAERGRIALARRHVKEAVGLLERSTRKDPGEADVYIALACAHERLAAEQDSSQHALTLEKARESCVRAKDIVGEHHPHWAAAELVEDRLNAHEPTPSPALAALMPGTEGARRSTPKTANPL